MQVGFLVTSLVALAATCLALPPHPHHEQEEAPYPLNNASETPERFDRANVQSIRPRDLTLDCTYLTPYQPPDWQEEAFSSFTTSSTPSSFSSSSSSTGSRSSSIAVLPDGFFTWDRPSPETSSSDPFQEWPLSDSRLLSYGSEPEPEPARITNEPAVVDGTPPLTVATVSVTSLSLPQPASSYGWPFRPGPPTPPPFGGRGGSSSSSGSSSDGSVEVPTLGT